MKFLFNKKQKPDFKHDLNLTYRDAIEHLWKLGKQYDSSFTLHKSLPVGFGYVKDFKMHVGIGGLADPEICKNLDTASRQKHLNHYFYNIRYIPEDAMIPDINFMTALVTTCHELRHYEQFTKQNDFDDNPHKSDIYKDYAIACFNPELYRQNHKRMRHEIDAEHYGILKAYEYMKSEMNILDADKYIAEYIKHQVSDSRVPYFIPGYDTSSVSDISASFERAIMKPSSWYYDVPSFIKTDQSLRLLVHPDFRTDFDKFHFDSSPDEQKDILYDLVKQLHPDEKMHSDISYNSPLDIKITEQICKDLKLKYPKERFIDKLRRKSGKSCSEDIIDTVTPDIT